MITVYILLGLTFIIFIHELGHFLAARWCGVQVYTFSIGFGPRLITFYRDSKGTDYILSLIPLGGYVRMKGQEDLPSSGNSQMDSMSASRDSDHFLSKKPWQRLWIILAGVKMNLISAIIFVIIAYMIGIPFSSNVIGGFFPDSPARDSGLRTGDEIIEVNGVKTDTMESIITSVALQDRKGITQIKALRPEGSGYREVNTEINLNTGEELPQLGIVPKTELSIASLPADSELYRLGLRNGDILEGIIVSDGFPPRNYSGSMILEYIKNHPGDILSIRYRDHEGEKLLKNVQIGEKKIPDKGFYLSSRVQVIKGYPADEAGIKDGDAIISLNKKPIRYWEEIISELQNSDPDKSIEIKVKREGQELVYDVKPHYDNFRGSLILGVTVYTDPESRSQEIAFITPQMESMVPGIRVGDRLVNYNKEGDRISVELIREGNQISFTYQQSQLGEKAIGYLFDYSVLGKTIRYSLVDAVPASLKTIKQEFTEVLGFFYLLIKGEMPMEVMGGPIAIFEVSYQVANTKGWSYFVLLLAKISISLVILNLLPIPVLDGGHACIIIYEMIRRKPVPERALRFFQALGIVFLLALIIYVNYNDVSRLLAK